MGADHFLAAAFRHERDARHLESEGRIDNAAYLAGYTIECGLKALVEAVGHGTPKTHDLHRLEAVALLATLGGADRHRDFPAESVETARQTGWGPDWRYHADGSVPPAIARDLVAAAGSVVTDTLALAILDGRVAL